MFVASVGAVAIAIAVDVAAIIVPYRGIDSIQFNTIQFDSIHSRFTDPLLVAVIK